MRRRPARRFANLLFAASAFLLIDALSPPHLQAQEGQIIIIRPVPSRPATRPGVPAPPFAVKTAPPVDVSPALAIREAIGVGVPEALVLSDIEAATVSTGSGLSLRGSLQRLRGDLGSVNGGGARTSEIGRGMGASRQSVGVAGAVQRSTGGIGRTIVNAVAPQ